MYKIKILVDQYRKKIINHPLNIKIDQKGEQFKNNFLEIIDFLVTHNKFRRNFRLFFNLVIFTGIGYFVSSITQFTHLQELIFCHRRNIDRSFDYLMMGSQIDFRKKDILDTQLNNFSEKENVDLLSWISLGQNYANQSMAEYAQTAYYMAHLKDPSLIQTGYDLKFDTVQGQNQITLNSNKEEILSALLD